MHSLAMCSDSNCTVFAIAVCCYACARRIALTRIELGNTVSAHWSVVRAQALLSKLPTTQNAVFSPSATPRVNDEERPSNRAARRAACQRVPVLGGHNNEAADIGPARVCIGSDACPGGASP